MAGNIRVLGFVAVLTALGFLLAGCLPAQEAPRVLSSNPADGADPVSIITDLRVVFSKSVAPQTVSDSTVFLRPSGGDRTLAGSVSLDSETDTLTFVPAIPLGYGVTYVLELSGIEDSGGRPLESPTLTFDTYHNPQIRYIQSSGGVVGPSYYDYHYDADGVSTWYGGFKAGVDGEWFTADDEMYFHGDTTVNGPGDRTLKTFYDPGVDQEWFTSDDVPNWHAHYLLDGEGRYYRTDSFASGVDGVWGTADDEVSSYSLTLFDENGIMSGGYSYDGAGADGIWFTDDDDVSGYYLTQPTPEGQQPWSISYTAGVDGVWETADDAIGAVFARIFDAAGLPVRLEGFSGPGDDQEWFTADDVLFFFNQTVFDPLGNRIRAQSTAPGPDGVFFTADDILGNIAEFDTGF